MNKSGIYPFFAITLTLSLASQPSTAFFQSPLNTSPAHQHQDRGTSVDQLSQEESSPPYSFRIPRNRYGGGKRSASHALSRAFFKNNSTSRGKAPLNKAQTQFWLTTNLESVKPQAKSALIDFIQDVRKEDAATYKHAVVIVAIQGDRAIVHDVQKRQSYSDVPETEVVATKPETAVESQTEVEIEVLPSVEKPSLFQTVMKQLTSVVIPKMAELMKKSAPKEEPLPQAPIQARVESSWPMLNELSKLSYANIPTGYRAILKTFNRQGREEGYKVVSDHVMDSYTGTEGIAHRMANTVIQLPGGAILSTAEIKHRNNLGPNKNQRGFVARMNVQRLHKLPPSFWATQYIQYRNRSTGQTTDDVIIVIPERNYVNRIRLATRAEGQRPPRPPMQPSTPLALK